jgi:hypothetical protein
MRFKPSQTQDLDSVQPLRGGARQPVLGVARLLMKWVASHDLFHDVIVTRPGHRRRRFAGNLGAHHGTEGMAGEDRQDSGQGGLIA